MPAIVLIETDILPLCPHCEKPLHIIEKHRKGILNITILYACGACHKLLSIGYSFGA